MPADMMPTPPATTTLGDMILCRKEGHVGLIPPSRMWAQANRLELRVRIAPPIAASQAAIALSETHILALSGAKPRK
jgi:hypothetical protein